MTRCERCRQAQATVRHDDVALCADCYEQRRLSPPAPRAPFEVRAKPRD